MAGKSDRRPEPETVLDEALRKCRGAFLTVGVFSLAINLLMLSSPLYMLQVYDRVLSSGRTETLVLLTENLAFLNTKRNIVNADR